jgi:hypothetical protein
VQSFGACSAWNQCADEQRAVDLSLRPLAVSSLFTVQAARKPVGGGLAD